MTETSPHLWLASREDEIVSAWTASTGDIHFHSWGFDDYDTPVIQIDIAYEDREAVTALDWERTHREWTGETWRMDFEALEHAVQHFLEQGYTVTVAGPELSIYRSDYDASFLTAHLPADPPPTPSLTEPTDDAHPTITDF